MEEHKERNHPKRSLVFLAHTSGWLLMLFTARGNFKKIEVVVVIVELVTHAVWDIMNLRYF